MSTTNPPSTFPSVPDMIAAHARVEPERVALVDGPRVLSYRELIELIGRVGALVADLGVRAGDAVAVCAESSIEYAAVFLGCIRLGIVVAPLDPAASVTSLARMLSDCNAKLVFVDDAAGQRLAGVSDGVLRVRLQALGPGAIDATRAALGRVIVPGDACSETIELHPGMPFNIIYSSGTTGEPKGIVHSHGMRGAQAAHSVAVGYGRQTVALVSTPLYSNTTLIGFFAPLCHGGAVVLMSKFTAAEFLRLSAQHRVTHAVLVPVQYQRILEAPELATSDLSSYQVKFCTSAPFAAELKQRVVERWPGMLIEYYGMTEGGGTCVLMAHQYPNKLHTVGRPAPGHEIKLIGDDDREVAPGEVGEVVGWSPATTMSGYHRQPGKTADAAWSDGSGRPFIRTGDVGRFDEDGFLILLDRKKDMIISGGFNIYPKDLESILAQHPAVAEVSVVGVPSPRWGETPVAFVVCREGDSASAEQLREYANAQLGAKQRLSDIVLVEGLPRSSIGKVLKRELRTAYRGAPQVAAADVAQ